MAKKLVFIISLFTLTFALTSCGPNNIPVEWVDVQCSVGEIYVGEIVDLTIVFLPANATNQGYTLIINNPAISDFIGGLQVQGLSPGESMVTVTSDDGGHTNQCQVYVHPLP